MGGLFVPKKRDDYTNQEGSTMNIIHQSKAAGD